MIIDTNINIQDNCGFTKLIRAVLKEEEETVYFLLQQQYININLKDSGFNTALIHAIRLENDKIINLINNFNFNKALLKLKKTLMKFYWLMREQIEKKRMHPNSPYLLNIVNNFD